MKIFVDMITAIAMPSGYNKLVKNAKWRKFLHVFLVTAVPMCINLLIVWFGFSVLFGFRSIEELYDRYVPEFTFEDSTLYIDEVYEFDEDGVYIYVNTDDEHTIDNLINEVGYRELKKKYKNYTNVVIIGNDGIFTKNDGYRELYFDDIVKSDEVCNKESLHFLVNMIRIGIIVAVVIGLIFSVVMYFIGAGFLALFGMLYGSARGKKIAGGRYYSMAIYAKTAAVIMGIVLNIIMVLFSFKIPYIWFYKIAIDMLYICLAINKYSEENTIYSSMNTQGGTGNYNPANTQGDTDNYNPVNIQSGTGNYNPTNMQGSTGCYNPANAQGKSDPYSVDGNYTEQRSYNTDVGNTQHTGSDLKPKDSWSFGDGSHGEEK